MKSFSWTTGWVAVAVAVIGALTAADVLPLVGGFLTTLVGADAAHKIGAVLAALGGIVAKLSHSTKPATPST